MNVSPIPTTRIHKDLPKDQIIRDINSSTQTRRMTKIIEEYEPKKVIKALTDPSWIEAMQEELLQFKLQKVWTLVDLPKGKRAIGTKWVYKNKKDERGIVVRNKARLVAQGLHQAPRAWYETLSTYLLENGFRRGTIDKTLFIKDKGDILLVKVYVDDIIFGSTKNSLCVEFEQMMYKKFQMSSIGELTFFLRLQVMQKDDGIFISQDKYVADILKKFEFITINIASTPIETNKALLKDKEAKDVDVHLYRSMIGSLMYLTASKLDIMFVVCACARFQVTLKVSHLNVVKRIFRYLKALTGNPQQEVFQFHGKRLIPLQCKKQTIVANSTTETEYVATTNCCGQVLWIQNQMLNYGFNFMNTKIHIDNNESTICIVKNPVFHSKTKHVEIRHHFIRDSYEKKLIQVIKIHTDHNVANLTKAFNVSRKAKRTTEISQSSGPIHLDADETIYKEWEDMMERAATTASSLEAEQDNEAQIIFEASSKQSNDPPLSIVNTLGSVEDNMKLKELMELFRHKLMLPGITSYCWIQALVDKKKVIISETSIRSDLKLDDAEGTNCLPTATIFAELERMGYENLNQKLIFYKAYFSSQWKFLIHTILQCLSAKTTSWNEFSSTMASAIICLATNQNFNLSKYIFDNMVKNLDGGAKFLMYPRFAHVFLDKQVEGMSKHKGVYVTPSHTKKVLANMKTPCMGFSRKKKSKRKQTKDSAPIEPTTKETTHEEHVSTPSYDPPLSGEDRMQLVELMSLCTNLQEKVLDLEKAKTSQAKEIASLKKRDKQVESSNDANLGAQEDASKQGRKIEDLDADAEVTLVDETQEMNDDNLMFDKCVFEEQGIELEKVVEEPVVSVSTTIKSIPVSAAEIKTAKPKPVTTAATTVTSVRPRAKGLIFHDQEEQLEVPLKKKDQAALDEEMARNLEAQLQAELIKEERLARQKEEEANIALIKS
ncbi:putative ribonuclease H-like domain-containing protein [Tanacetum coccineum]